MYPFTHFFLWLCLGALWLRLSTPSPVRVSVPITPSNTPNVEEFLLRYGYLGETDRNSINLLSADRLRDAIIEMQKFANLEPTGVADNTTLALMSGMRCGIPDIIHSSHPNKRRFKRYFLQGSKWNRTALTWSLKEWPADMDYHSMVEEFQKAFHVWSEASKLTFTDMRRGSADIEISFLRGRHGDEYPFDGPGAILGHAFFPGDDIGGDAHFDADEQWDKRRSNEIDRRPGVWAGVSLFSVAAHEFGHSLGLSHSSVSGSLMFPYYQTLDDNFRLPYDDTNGIQQLYGRRGSSDPRAPSFPTLPTTKLTNRPTKWSTIPKFSSEFPNPCDISIDAIASIRKNIFIFKSKYFWWLQENRDINRAEPTEITHYWPHLPKDLVKVDAVYERHKDAKIVFFIGKKYYVFNNQNHLEPGYPKTLVSMGLPETLDKVDAVMIWGHNAKTYIFSGSQYWRFDEEDNRVELDYPRDMTVWKGIPVPIDAAFQWASDGHTYFFKGKQFWKFDNRKMQSSDGYPHSIGPFWFRSLHCRVSIAPGGKIDVTSSVYSINLKARHWIKSQTLLILLSNYLLFYNFYILHIFYN